MRIKVSVTAADIRKGNVASVTRCPIALAFRRALKGRFVICWLRSVSVGDQEYMVPKKAVEFQNRLLLNSKAKVKPFSFVLNVPKSVVLGKEVPAIELPS